VTTAEIEEESIEELHVQEVQLVDQRVTEKPRPEIAVQSTRGSSTTNDLGNEAVSADENILDLDHPEEIHVRRCEKEIEEGSCWRTREAPTRQNAVLTIHRHHLNGARAEVPLYLEVITRSPDEVHPEALRG
jgi:hypothetical protein